MNFPVINSHLYFVPSPVIILPYHRICTLYHPFQDQVVLEDTPQREVLATTFLHLLQKYLFSLWWWLQMNISTTTITYDLLSSICCLLYCLNSLLCLSCCVAL